eukprot:11949115-Alexandrium_andersonii.AAC.1
MCIRDSSLPYAARRLWPDIDQPAASQEAICLATQCSVDRLERLILQLVGWASEAAVAIYVNAPPASQEALEDEARIRSAI